MSAPVVLDLYYTEPELVALYDQQNPRGEDYDFFIELVRRLTAKTVVKLQQPNLQKKSCPCNLITRNELSV